MSGIVMAAMPRLTRRYDHGAQQAEEEAGGFGSNGNIATTRPADVANHSGLGSGYAPATANDPSLKCVTFRWARACDTYTLRGSTVVHKGGGVNQNRPVIGDFAMAPGTGKYFFEVRLSTASCRIGLCSQAAYPAESSLLDTELGHLPPGGGAAHPQLQMGERAVVAALDGQSSRVLIDGQVVKHLWRLFVPSSGALFSFIVDTDDGVVQLFVDRKYQGMVFGPSAGLRGATLYPCVSLAGLDMHNRNIGTGNISATVSPAHKFDCLY